MNALRLIAAAFLMLGIIAGVRADKADANKDKIVGIWEVTKSEDPPPVGAVIEFGKDGKVKVPDKQDNKDVVIEGTYTIEGDKLTVVLKFEGSESKQTGTIKKLGKDEMSLVGENGKVVEFKRKKAAK